MLSFIICTDLVNHARRILMNLLRELNIRVPILVILSFAQMFAAKTF